MKRGWFLAILALAGLLLGLQAKLWWGEGGWREAQALRATVEAQKAENARLQQRNDALAAEVEDLKSGEAAVEERARSELGMVKPGETFYRVVEPHADTAAAQAAREGIVATDEGRDVLPAEPAPSPAAPTEPAPVEQANLEPAHVEPAPAEPAPAEQDPAPAPPTEPVR
jgi:cell division protein FtsB